MAGFAPTQRISNPIGALRYEEEQYRQMREAYQTHTKEWEEFKRSYKHETSPEVKQMIDEMNAVCNALFPHAGG